MFSGGTGNVLMSKKLKIIDIVVHLCFTKFSKFAILVFSIHVIDNGKESILGSHLLLLTHAHTNLRVIGFT